MNKVFLIIKREFVTRVRKKSFIIMTLLGPLLFAGVFILPIWLATRDSDNVRTIEVDDDSGLFINKLQESSNLKFMYVNVEDEQLFEHALQTNNYGVLHIPDLEVSELRQVMFYAKSNPGIDLKEGLRRTVNRELENIKWSQSGLSREEVDQLKGNIFIDTNIVTDDGEKSGSAEIATGVGYLASFLIYFFIFLFGAQVMRGVIEEKTNRIVEIIVSSVRPFQLMMGKIIGVASVGLAQFLLWILLTFGIVTFAQSYFNVDQIEQTQEQFQSMSSQKIEAAKTFNTIFEKINSLPVGTIVIAFIFYFLGGYFLYGALFAAVGSAADSDTDTQQFMLPITIPLIISIVSLGAVLKEPDGALAFWLSMIPFTSPIVMMMRIPFVTPLWQIILSMVLLALGFFFTTWMASKIYRIGILAHGSKVNYHVLWKWLVSKN